MLAAGIALFTVPGDAASGQEKNKVKTQVPGKIIPPGKTQPLNPNLKTARPAEQKSVGQCRKNQITGAATIR